MASSDYGEPQSSPVAMAASWEATLVLGVLTVILGVIVSLHPSGSLNVLAVLLGILMILSGIFPRVSPGYRRRQHARSVGCPTDVDGTKDVREDQGQHSVAGCKP